MNPANPERKTPSNELGALLRHWRDMRGISQLDLSFNAGVSQRHISFVESGRSVPSRQMLLDLAQALDIPLRERNTLLLAAGYAPMYADSAWNAQEMRSVTSALGRMLRQHEPFPALVMDRYWNVLMTNDQHRRFSHGSRNVGDKAEVLLELPQHRPGWFGCGINRMNLEGRHDRSSIVCAARDERRDDRRLGVCVRLANYLGCNKFRAAVTPSPAPRALIGALRPPHAPVRPVMKMIQLPEPLSMHQLAVIMSGDEHGRHRQHERTHHDSHCFTHRTLHGGTASFTAGVAARVTAIAWYLRLQESVRRCCVPVSTLRR